MNAIDASAVLRAQLAAYAAPNTFSMHWGYREARIDAVVTRGRTVGATLAPARHTLALAFDRPDGLRITITIEEASVPALVNTACGTIAALLKPMGPA